eukprot:s2564_g4.t1
MESLFLLEFLHGGRISFQSRLYARMRLASVDGAGLLLKVNVVGTDNSSHEIVSVPGLMVRKDGKYGPRYEKSRGFIDMGSHSCFGDFPHDYLPEGVKDKLKTAKQSRTQMLPRIHSAPGLTQTQGFSWNPHLPPDSPPATGCRRRQLIPTTHFRNFYDRGDLPIAILHGSGGWKTAWKVDVERLDYHHYLPIFFEGLREKEDFL